MFLFVWKRFWSIHLLSIVIGLSAILSLGEKYFLSNKLLKVSNYLMICCLNYNRFQS